MSRLFPEKVHVRSHLQQSHDETGGNKTDGLVQDSGGGSAGVDRVRGGRRLGAVVVSSRGGDGVLASAGGGTVGAQRRGAVDDAGNDAGGSRRDGSKSGRAGRSRDGGRAGNGAGRAGGGQVERDTGASAESLSSVESGYCVKKPMVSNVLSKLIVNDIRGDLL